MRTAWQRSAWWQLDGALLLPHPGGPRGTASCCGAWSACTSSPAAIAANGALVAAKHLVSCTWAQSCEVCSCAGTAQAACLHSACLHAFISCASAAAAPGNAAALECALQPHLVLLLIAADCCVWCVCVATKLHGMLAAVQCCRALLRANFLPPCPMHYLVPATAARKQRVSQSGGVWQTTRKVATLPVNAGTKHLQRAEACMPVVRVCCMPCVICVLRFVTGMHLASSAAALTGVS
jgi:hypothetical protein